MKHDMISYCKTNLAEKFSLLGLEYRSNHISDFSWSPFLRMIENTRKCRSNLGNFQLLNSVNKQYDPFLGEGIDEQFFINRMQNRSIAYI